MIHNINVYRSTGEPHRVRVFNYAADDACNLPDGSQILHAEQLFDDSGEYLQLWASVPESSELARESRIIEEVDDTPASDLDDRLNVDFGTNDEDEEEDDDGAAFKL